MAKKRITVSFTEAELLAFRYAAGHVLNAGDPDEVKSFFGRVGNHQTAKAAYRAMGSIDDALAIYHLCQRRRSANETGNLEEDN